MEKLGFTITAKEDSKITPFLEVISKFSEEILSISTKLENQILIQTRKGQSKIKINNLYTEFRFKNRVLKFYHGGKSKLISNTLAMIYEQFIMQNYSKIRLRNASVIDIGANIGDSAIYFAMSSAKHVYAFEPYPYTYSVALKNLKTNNLLKKITLLNEGYGRIDCYIKIDPYYKSSASDTIIESEKGKQIKINTLKTIVEKFKIKDGLLKMDCEGCEYNLIYETTETLRKFKGILIEYHYGYIPLLKKLESSGFEVNFTKPYKTKLRSRIGFIIGKRIN